MIKIDDNELRNTIMGIQKQIDILISIQARILELMEQPEPETEEETEQEEPTEETEPEERIKERPVKK